MNEKQQKLLNFLSIFSVGTLLISNLAAIKIWDLIGIPADGGLLTFPLIYILSDITVEFFGKETARGTLYAGLALNIAAIIVFKLVALLPAYPGWTKYDVYNMLANTSTRIIIASLIAYLASQILDHLLFERVKEQTGEKPFWIRSIGSSVLARLVDSAIFETIAFLGVLPTVDFVKQAFFAWGAGTLIEILLLPVSSLLVRRIRKSLEKPSEEPQSTKPRLN